MNEYSTLKRYETKSFDGLKINKIKLESTGSSAYRAEVI